MRLIAPLLRVAHPLGRASRLTGYRARRDLFLPRLHQARLEENWIELGIVVPPALVSRLGVARLDDEAGLFGFGLEVGALQRRDDVVFEKAQAVFRDAFRTDDAAPRADDDIEALLAE